MVSDILEIGMHVGNKYKILKILGIGSNGSVYLVKDIGLDICWAMKEFCIPNVDEMNWLKKVNHPRFPRIVDCFIIEQKMYLVMDYIKGITVKEKMEQGEISCLELVHIGLQVLDGLSYLHRSIPQILYLDLKPSNLIIDENNTIKLVDLGSMQSGDMIVREQLSGTIGYASVEQANGDISQIDETSDIYSFGSLLFALSTGKNPRDSRLLGENGEGLDVRGINPAIPSGIAYVIEKCTRYNKKVRYQTVEEIEKDLKHYSFIGKKKRNLFAKKRKSQLEVFRKIIKTQGNSLKYLNY